MVIVNNGSFDDNYTKINIYGPKLGNALFSIKMQGRDVSLRKII